MACSECYKVNDVAVCTDTITVGTLAISTPYKVYFEMLSPRKVFAIDAVTDGAGLLVVTIPEDTLRMYKTYKLWATLTTSSLHDKEDITIDGAVQCCIEFHTLDTEITNQTLSAASTCS